MNEAEYKELVEFLIEQLEEKGAIDVVNQIKEVAVSKVTVDTISNEDFKKPQKTVEDFAEISKETANTKTNSKTSNFNNDIPKSDYKYIGKTRLRNLTNKEIFSEAIEILTNYLQTTPKMAYRISVLFKTGVENIVWKFDKEETFYKIRKDFLPSMLAVTNDETKINECLNILKAEVTNRGSLDDNKSST